jgi:hypothetical protein
MSDADRNGRLERNPVSLAVNSSIFEKGLTKSAG